jgi:hypothetical protein
MATRNLGELIECLARPEHLAEHLDRLGNTARVDEVTSLERRHMVRLWEMVENAHPMSLEHYVGAECAPMEEVVHWGKNSLPAFRRFQKRFVRPTEGAEELWGYNEQTMRHFTGPGYFVTYESDQDDTPVWIDYTMLPPGKASAWPSILPNSARLSRFIYNGTVDKMRKVSDHVSIGAAFKQEKALGAYFMLCRDA